MVEGLKALKIRLGTWHQPGVHFLDVISQTPRLLDMLQPDSIKCLLGTSTALRKLVKPIITSIQISSHNDLPLLFGGGWPSLQRVTFASLGVEDSTALYLTGELHSVQWLSLAFCKHEALANMTRGNWPWLALTKLDLRFYMVLPRELAVLADHQWPFLEVLNLSCCYLDDSTVAPVFNGDWPILQTLTLSDNSLCDLEGLDTSEWGQLQCLSLSHNPLSLKGFKRVINMPWPLMETMSFDSIQGANQKWLLMTEATWPVLQTLSLMDNDLPVAAIKNIACMSLSTLTTLDLSGNQMGRKAVKWLIKGNWPHLQRLRLQNCFVEAIDTIMLLLTEGVWPELAHLILYGNQIDASALVSLTCGKWPLLTHIDMGDNKLHDGAFVEMAALLDDSNDYSFYNPKQICSWLWPKLVWLRW